MESLKMSLNLCYCVNNSHLRHSTAAFLSALLLLNWHLVSEIHKS
jgi:hypothetical protein